MASAMEEAGFNDIRVYIQNRQNTAAQYIATRTILDLSEQYVQRPGAWFSWRFWDQEEINFGVARERAGALTDG